MTAIVRVLASAAVGFEGRSVWLQAGDAYPAGHELVRAHPDRFTPPEDEPADPERPRRGRRPADG